MRASIDSAAEAAAVTRAAPPDQAAVPLVVDVDGTLVRSDLLVEAVFRFLAGQPHGAVALVRWWWRGKAVLKDELARRVALPAAHLPYNDAVLDVIHAARKAGRPVFLASASPRARVEEIAAHLGLFDGVFASDRTSNLKGAQKARALVDAFGERGFDYLGDGPGDGPVWRLARRALAVRGGAAALRRSTAETAETGIVDVPAVRWGAYLEALRPQQWTKNLLVFLPLLAAQSFTLAAFAAAASAFAVFSLAASGAYVVNDLADLQDDRRHATKRRRPFAAAAVPLWHGVALAPLLLLGAVLFGALLSLEFLVVLLVYVATTFLYSFLLRHKPLIDVLTLAMLYTLRAIAGAMAIATTVSPWLLAFCLALFMCLAIVKRLTELAKAPRDEPTARIRGYYREDTVILAALAAASGFGSVLVLALYINTDQVRTLYTTPDVLWGVCLVLLYWISRILLLSHRGQITDDPIVWALRNRVSQLTVASALALVVTAAYV